MSFIKHTRAEAFEVVKTATFGLVNPKNFFLDDEEEEAKAEKDKDKKKN